MLYHSFHARTQLELETHYLRKKVQIRRACGRRQTGTVCLVSALAGKVVVSLDAPRRDEDLLVTVPIHTLHRRHTFRERLRSWWQRLLMSDRGVKHA
jgi:hypothetical protein